MNWRLNKLSYLSWVIYTMVSIGAVFLAVEGLCSSVSLSIPAVFVATAGGLALICGITFLLYKLRRNIKTLDTGHWIWSSLESLLFILFFVKGLLMRLETLMVVPAGKYYDLAVVSRSQNTDSIVNVTEFCYVNLLKTVCFVLGNQPFFCICLQLGFGLLVAILCYFAIRKISGCFSALVFAGVFFLSPTMVHRTVQPNPVVLLLLVFSIALYLIAFYLKTDDENWLMGILAGCAVGAAGYFDISGFFLLLPVLSVVTVEKEYSGFQQKKRFLSLISVMLSGLVSFGVLLGLDTLQSGAPVGEICKAHMKGFSFSGDLKSILSQFTPDIGDVVFWTIMAAFLGIGVVSFFLRKRTERITPWVWTFLLTIPGYLFGGETEKLFFGLAILLTACILAGGALSNLFVPAPEIPQNRIYRFRSEEDEGDRAAESVTAENREEKSEKNSSKEDTSPAMEGEMKEEPLAVAVSSSKGILRGMMDERARRKAQQQQEIDWVLNALSSISEDTKAGAINPEHFESSHVDAQEKKKGVVKRRKKTAPGTRLENPLPLPKKHVGNVMDYDYEVADDDDFDI